MIKEINFIIIKKRYRDFLRFSAFILPYWKMEAIIMTLSAILLPLGLVMPYLTKLVIDEAFIKRDLALFIRLIIFGAVIFIITTLVETISSYLDEKLGLRINFDLNSKIFGHIQRLSLSFFRDKTTGEHIYKLNFDSANIANMITSILPQFMLLFLRLLFILVIVFYLNWKMALFCLAISPILYIITFYYIPKRQDIYQKQIESSQNIFVRLQEVFSHIHLVKAFGREDFEIRDFLKRLSERLKLMLRAKRLGLYNLVTDSALSKLVLGLLSVYGGYQIIKGQMTLGSLTAIMIYFSQLIDLQISVDGLFQQLSFGFVSCDRIIEVLDRQPDITDKLNAVAIKLANADIKFENVTFGYKPDAPVLKDLNFSITGDLTVALVGNSGCGKTTLINLLIRLYEPQNGRISIGGYDIKDIKIDCLKNQTGVVLQEPFLWNDTIENNIRYGNPDASFAQIVEAAQISGADTFIDRLPKGYKTHIGENASLISEGQKQRISIARTIIRNPKIIIFDEAMSSLDSESEDRIIDNLKTKFNNSTIIIVSHRLSAVKKMNLLYFLEAPDKMAVGRHEEFLENNSRYRKLFSSQIEQEGSYKLH